VGAVAVALTVLACGVGALGWPLPERTTSGWQVTDVAPSLLALVLATAVLSLSVGTMLVRRSLDSPGRTAIWVVLGSASMPAQVWNDLYLAALAGPGGVIPVFGWAFTFVPAVAAGLLARSAGRVAHSRATLGTAVVTLPMVGLGWSLYGSADGVASGLFGSLWSAGILGVLPVLIALAITRPPPARRPAPAAT
jgi:hypothetical protein